MMTGYFQIVRRRAVYQSEHEILDDVEEEVETTDLDLLDQDWDEWAENWTDLLDRVYQI